MQFGKQEIVALLVILLVIAAAAFYVFQKNEKVAQQNSDAGKALLGSGDRVAEYTNLSGEPISLQDYNGRPRVVNSWATWCPYCKDELPALAEVARAYSDSDIAFIAINRGERKEKVQSFITKVGASEQLVHVLNPNDSFYNVIGGAAMPETVFYDANGAIVFHVRGVMSKAEIEKRVEALLNPDTE